MISTPSSPRPSSRTILIADPDHEAVRWLGPLLRDRGFQIHAASDGSQALQMTLLRHPDLILFDQACGLIEVEAFLRILRSNPRTESIPVVITGHHLDAGRHPTAQGAIAKPFDEDELFGRLEQVLRGARLSKPLQESELHGQLAQLPIPDLLQVLAMNHRSGRLVIRSGGVVGEILVVQGRVHDARVQGVSGEKALYRIFAWKEGSFELLSEELQLPDRIRRSLDTLLLDGSYQADELARLRPKLPGASEPIGLTVVPASIASPAAGVAELLGILGAGPRTVSELFDRSAMTDLDVATALLDLLDRGWAWVVPSQEAPAVPPLLQASELHILRQKILRSRGGSTGPLVAKLLIAAEDDRSIGQIADRLAGLPALEREPEREPEPSGVGTLARVELGEEVRLDLVGLPTSDELRPLWPLWATGAVGALIFDAGPGGDALSDHFSSGKSGIPLLTADQLLSLDPAQAVRDLLATVTKSR